MSTATMPARLSSSLSPLTSTPAQIPRNLRFIDVDPLRPTPINLDALSSPGDPFIAYNKFSSLKLSGNITKATEYAFHNARKTITDCERIAEEYAKSLDEKNHLYSRLRARKRHRKSREGISQCSQKYALGEDRIDDYKKQFGLAQSIYAPTPGRGRGSRPKPTYTQATTFYQPDFNKAYYLLN